MAEIHDEPSHHPQVCLKYIVNPAIILLLGGNTLNSKKDTGIGASVPATSAGSYMLAMLMVSRLKMPLLTGAQNLFAGCLPNILVTYCLVTGVVATI